MQADPQVAKQYQRWLDIHAKAKNLWDQADRELRKLARVAKLGRKKRVIAAISDSRGVRIENQFRGEDKVFAPAFARKLAVKEVSLEHNED